MLHPLAKRVFQVQCAASRMRWLCGLSHFVIVAVASVVALALLDYWMRSDAPLARWALSAVAVAALAFALTKLLFPNLFIRPDSITMARRIERRFPQLQERLSSAVAFLKSSDADPTAGSADLRRAVIAEAEAISAGLDFSAVLDHRSALRALALGTLILVLAATISTFNQSIAGLAIARLLLPWREVAWPRRHALAFVDPPRRIARGDDFEVVLMNERGRLPADAEILIRHETPTGWLTDVQPLRPTGERVAYRLPKITEGFEYRARGGDDDTMPWTKLNVVAPPRITELLLDVRPPAYSGLPAVTQTRTVSALVGSQLRLMGQTDRPIRSVLLRAHADGLALPDVQISADRQSFTAPGSDSSWVVEMSDAVSIDLVDEHGLTHPGVETIALRALPDAPATIAWELPESHAEVTASATVHIQAIVKDDLAIRGVQLCYTRLGGSDEQSIELGSADGTQVNIDSSWDLSSLKDLKPGEEINIRLTASDSKNQVTSTTVRRLSVLSDQAFDARIADLQYEILSRVKNALRLARQGRDQSRVLQSRRGEGGEISADESADLQRAIHGQQEVERALANSPDGLAGRIADLLLELTANQVDPRSAGPRLRELSIQLDGLHKGPLPEILRALTDASKSSQRDEFFARVTDAENRQDDVITALERMVARLANWDSFGRIVRDLEQIREDQERLRAAIEALRLDALLATPDGAQPDRAAARQQTERQLELARKFDTVQNGMLEARQRLSNDDPTAAALNDALELARQLALGSRMREAASRLSQGQLGEALRNETEILDGLRQLALVFSPAQSTDGRATNANSANREDPNTNQPGRGAAKPGAGGREAVLAPTQGTTSRIERGSSVVPQDVVRRLWGHLPERMRQEMQSSFSEQFLPQYERLIEEYYRRLAEERPSVP